MTRKDAKRIVGTDKVTRCYFWYSNSANIEKLGENYGYLGLNWVLFLDKETNEFYLYTNRNTPAFTNFVNC